MRHDVHQAGCAASEPPTLNSTQEKRKIMNASRRSFLRASSLAGVAAALAARFPRLALGQPKLARLPYTPLPKEVYASPLYYLSYANFYSTIGTLYTFAHSTKGNVSLRLYEVADLKPLYGKSRPAGKECFALTFIGPFNQKLKQGTYKVTDSKLGPFELFIVPSDTQSAQGLLYEANINRLYP
jgi:hypothetical protein